MRDLAGKGDVGGENNLASGQSCICFSQSSSLGWEQPLGSAPVLGISFPLAPPSLPSRNGSSICFYNTSMAFALPGRLSQTAVFYRMPALEECGQEIQVDFMEHNGQNKCQTQSEELKKPCEIPAGWV